MRLSKTIGSLALLPCALIPCALGGTTFTTSPKRGLIFIPNADTPQDNSIWTRAGSDLTWYYNYQPNPSPALAGSSLQFVPMLFTATATTSGTVFLDSVKSLISGGANVSHVLSFNEPDGTTNTGGSNISPQVAAAAWQRELEPLRKLGVKVGAPAVTGSPGGFTWLSDFFSACNCTADFIPIHWYGNFEGLASHMGQVRGTYPNLTMWVTEYALPNSPLSDTQYFFNTSAEYFDRLDYVQRYSYFGPFRSSKSNVGPNAAFLDQDGKLTDIGSWYLGGAATNVIPKASSGMALTMGSAWVLFVVGVCFCVL